MSYPPVLKAFHDRLLDSQYWTREAMLAEQRKYLHELILHARQNVPHYRHRFDHLFASGKEIDWDRWSDVPILSRTEVLANLDDLVATQMPEHQGPTRESFTSGSTGPALRVIDSGRAMLYHRAVIFRSQGWHSLDYRRDMVVWFGEDPKVAAAPAGEVSGPWGPPWDSRATGKRVALNRFASNDDVLKLLMQKDAGYFSARPAAADAAALSAIDQGLDIKLDAVMTFSTGVRPDEREDFRKAFGARTIVPYSAKEGHFIAQQCPTGTHFHINEEIVFVEVVDAEGRPCEVGQTGRVLVTLLYNYAQPLIRYELGDLATLGPPCSCGRTLRVLNRIDGRVAHLFRLPDGKRVSMSLSIDLQRAFGARYWQIAQVEPLLIEVRYVPSGGGSGDEEMVAGIIRQKTHSEMRVKFSRHDDLNRHDGRKFIEYVNELGD